MDVSWFLKMGIERVKKGAAKWCAFDLPDVANRVVWDVQTRPLPFFSAAQG